MKPIAVEGYRKTKQSYGAKNFSDLIEGSKSLELGIPTKKLYKTSARPNPKFEFEERVRGNIPTENIKLIDILQLPLGETDFSPNMLKLLGQLSKTNIPIIKSNLVKNRLSHIPIGRAGTFEDIYKLMDTPTYKFDPFEKVR